MSTLFAVSCAHCGTKEKSPASSEAVTVSVKYYYGQVVTTSPDGKIPYGPAKYSLAKRTVDTKTGNITLWSG
ncbi:hypothetical protein KKF84_07200 [Myxococcota bacterium]|nr:hypothetical protein [Myxococcota bacterium]MBU1535089.1 hypothetical protein [Myxococcota bacterium]